MQRVTDRIIRGRDQSRTERLFIESVWRKAYSLSIPALGTGFGLSAMSTTASSASEANDNQVGIYDATAADCVRLLASAALGGITPRSTRWLDLDVQGQTEDDRDPWLVEAADTVFAEIHAGNYDTAAYDLLQHVIISGQGVLFIDTDERGRLRFTTWPLAQCHLVASTEGGPVDTVYRTVYMTAQQAVNEYGDAVSSHVMKALESGSDRKFEIVQAIYPRPAGQYGAAADQKPFASCHVEVVGRHLLRESGYDVQPFVAPRWQVIDGGCYAVGPMYQALPTVSSLNEMMRIILDKAEFAVLGMYTMMQDGAMNAASVKVEPGAVVAVTTKDAFAPVPLSGNLQIGMAEVQDLRAQVRKLMLVDSLELPQSPNATATEIGTRMEIMRQILAPIYGRIQSEMLDPLVARCFDLLAKAGKLPPVPPNAGDWIINVRYINPVARSQRLAEVAAMDRLEMTLAQEAQIMPDVLDLYDFDAAARERAWLLGTPSVVIRQPEDVEQIRRSRAEQQQAQAQAMQQQMQQQQAVDVVKAAQ